MQGDSTLMLRTLHRQRTGLPIDDWVGSPQPIDPQHNVMVQTGKDMTTNNSMQRNALVSTDNQWYQARVQRRHLTTISKRHFHALH